jgi:predicted transcriptional regulator
MDAAHLHEGTDMTNMEQEHLASANFTELTAEIVAAYVANNSVPAGNLAELIATVHTAVSGLSQPAAPALAALSPAVNPKRSVQPDYIVCLEDGKRFKSLKRHLMTKYGLTPEEYRTKWGLPHDYPMVAPNYAAARSELAKSMGLGRKAGTKVKPKRGRAKK